MPLSFLTSLRANRFSEGKTRFYVSELCLALEVNFLILSQPLVAFPRRLQPLLDSEVYSSNLI